MEEYAFEIQEPLRLRLAAGPWGDDLPRAASRDWPAADWPGWLRYDTPFENKLCCENWSIMPEPCRQLLRRMAELITEPCVPDLSLRGAGMHGMPPGGRLDIHLDADHHAVNGMTRTMNSVLYLDHGWRDEWGGHLEFWDERAERCTLRMMPAFNQLLIFDPRACPHGVPSVVKCPAGRMRKTLAIFGYKGEWARSIQRAKFLPRSDWSPLKVAAAAERARL